MRRAVGRDTAAAQPRRDCLGRALGSRPRIVDIVKRFGSVIGLPAESRAEYERYHADVWPSVLERLSLSHIRNYSIFRHGELLFSYYEYTGDDYEADMAAMAADPETRRWWALQEALQSPLDDRADNEWWKSIPEIFHMD